LIGRANHLATLHLLVDQARKGHGGVVLISGDAGIGKSRLIAGATAYAASHNVLPVQGNSFPDDVAAPYAPVIDLLRYLFDQYPWTQSFALTSQVVEAFQPWFSHLFSGYTSPYDSPSSAHSQAPLEKRQLFERLVDFLTALSAHQPLLLVVEDLHWSDETSLELLQNLARRSRTCALLLVLSYRSEEVNTYLRDFLAQMDRERLAQELHLSPLLPAEVEAMVQTCLSLQSPGPPELFYAIYPLSEGNPFFLEELLQALFMAGELFVEGESWIYKPLSTLHLPRSVRAAVQQRVALLTEQAREVLTLAAVAGRRFDFTLLLELMMVQEAVLLQALKELIAAQLIVEESAEQFSFRHALTRQSIYSQLLARERQALHRVIAEAMESLYASTLEAHLVDLASHFYEASEWAKALAYGWQAGEKALHLYAPQAATEQLTRALSAARLGALTPPAMVYLLRGQAYETLGDFERAHNDYERALESARSMHDQSAEWQSLIALGFLWTGRDYTQAGTYYRQALELARSMNDQLLLAHSLNRLGNWHLNTEQPLEARHYHQEALVTFQKMNDQHGLAETFDLLGMAHYLSGNVSQGTAYYQQAVALFQQLGDRQGLVSSLSQLTVACGSDLMGPTMLTLSLAESRNSGEHALRVAREIGQRSAEAFTLFNLGNVLGTRGEYAQAFEMVQGGISICSAIEHHQWLTYGHFDLGMLYLDLLDLPIAQQHLEQALALSREIGSGYWIRLVSGLLALVFLAQRDVARAESTLTAAPDHDAPPQTFGQWLVWYSRAELALANDDPGLALEIADQLSASTNKLSPEHCNPRLSKVRGEALAALGRGAEAETALQAAQEAARVQGLQPLLWRIHLLLAKFFLVQHRQEDAKLQLSTVQEITRDLAACLPQEGLRRQFLAEVGARLPRVRPLTPLRAAKMRFGGLTEREREVAVLIAQSKTNTEIAQQLVVGKRTVETYVSNILSKLGMTSRTQIALWVHEKGLFH
jgi:DNA-binding CsgD family transcriptional regulator/tetratricopeptide (TPR) repeat protein